MSEDQWFYVDKGSQAGPVSVSELQQRAKDGLLKTSDLVWKEGMANWLESGQVSEISGGAGLSPGTVVDTGSPAPTSFGGAVSEEDQLGGGETLPPAEELAPAAARAVEPMEPVARAVQYAGFWKRAAAVIIDSVLLMIVFVPLVLLFGGVSQAAEGGPPAGSGILNILTTAVYWLYFAGMESSAKQATFGKLALGIKVTDLDGQQLSFLRATGRHFGKYLSSLILFIGYILAAFTEKKQALHDMIASTLVVCR